MLRMNSAIQLWAYVVLSGLAASNQAPVSPLPADQTIRSFTLPAGFKASVFAAEPDVVQPISFCLDDRGRLWVAENLSYPNWKPEGHDRIIILDDPENRGHFTRKTVFYDKLN